jgi:hypothetical protein
MMPADEPQGNWTMEVPEAFWLEVSAGIFTV